MLHSNPCLWFLLISCNLLFCQWLVSISFFNHLINNIIISYTFSCFPQYKHCFIQSLSSSFSVIRFYSGCELWTAASVTSYFSISIIFTSFFFVQRTSTSFWQNLCGFSFHTFWTVLVSFVCLFSLRVFLWRGAFTCKTCIYYFAFIGNSGIKYAVKCF